MLGKWTEGPAASYEPFIGGRFRHDIGIYLNYDAFVDFSANREATTVEVSKHKKAFVAAGRAMLANHLPFGVVTANGLMPALPPGPR